MKINKQTKNKTLLVPISYSVGIAPEIIRNGENGFLVSSNEEVEERIKELLSNAEKRLMMAEAAMKSGAVSQ